MEKRLLLRDTNGGLIAELLSFTYNAKRMGGAPTISATLHSFDELTITTDDYVEFNGEKYYIKHTPTSSKSNTDARYKYDLEFVSERIMLDEVYFHDASWSTVSGVSKAISKGSNFSFIGSIRTLADRINASLAFSKIEKYKVVVSDEFTEVEDKFIQFSDVFVSNAIQEFYNTFKIPYYFYWDEQEGKTVVFVTNGSAQSPTVPFEYGKDNALLSITKTNANYKIVNKCTGVGSSENLPYYYPNVSATGEHTFNADEDFGDTKINYDILDKHTNLRDGATLTYHKKPSEVLYKYLVVYRKWERKAANITSEYLIQIDGATSLKDTSSAKLQTDGYFKANRVSIEFTAQANDEVSFAFQQGVQTIDGTDGVVDEETVKLLYEIKEGDALAYVGNTIIEPTALNDGVFSFTAAKNGTYSASVYILFKVNGGSQKDEIPINLSATFTPYRKVYKEDYFTFDDNNKEIGVSLSGVTITTPKDGGKIVVSETLNWIEPQQVLMPSIYRGTNGIERYYIASNESVTSEGYKYDFNGHQFTNPYAEGRPKEHIITVDDLKPTIKGMWVNDERIDMFSAFAYDVNDNDEIDEENHYKHPFFYAKLKKLDFNLFDQASEKGEMTISFTSGKCASCSFTIVVDENTKKNLVQVDDSGNLVFDENGIVKQISPYQSKQQDTINNEVWIALRKEDSTMGVLMPNVSNNAKPTTEDTFVITNINLPLSYILNAEKQLENKIKEYLVNNNDDKFNFSIKFSRIYLAENKDVRDNISENSSLSVIYQGKESTLYVSSYTYKMAAGETLPEITVELSDTLASSNGVMRNVINQVKMEVMTSVANVDVVAQGARAFIRKDQNDQTVYRLTANELNVNTDSNVGGSLDVGSDAKVGGELSVERKATFEDNVEVGADVTVGDYREILGEIKGAKISQQGDAVFKSLRANYLEIFTLIYNKIRATSAYTAFDDTATIIDITEDENGVYTLTFEGDAEYIQPFTEYDIVHGFVNSLNNYGYSIAGECWMNIVEVQPNDNNNQVKAILFSDEDTPSKNIAPTKNMVIGHKGNNAPKGLDDAKYDKRRNTFFISSADGNIVQLMDVTSPKLLDIKDGYSNYGVVMGKLPPDLFEYIKSSYSFVSENDPILYAKYVAVQNLLQIDYLGRLIKTERYRGEWNKDVAEGKDEDEEVYRSLNATDVTYYDTVSYEGSKWQCFTDKTTEAPSKDSTAWTIIVSKGDKGDKGENGLDNSSVTFELQPNVTTIYIHDEDNLSTESINLTVRKATSKGVEIIDNNADLQADGFKLQYTYDGILDDRKDIILNPETILLEDGSEMLLEDDSAAELEFTVEDILNVKNYIEFYLVKADNNEIWATCTVAVVHDGESTLSVELSIKDITANVNVETEPWQVLDPTTEYQVNVQVKKGGVAQDLSKYTLSNKSNTDVSSSKDTFGFITIDDYTKAVILPITNGMPFNYLPKWVEFTAVNKSHTNRKASDKLYIKSSQRGWTGPMGNDGASYYPQGEWDANTEYVVTKNSDGVVIARPIVYHDPLKNGNGTYYVLEADKSMDDDPVEFSPSVWRAFQSFEYLFTKVLMAQWAQLAYAVFRGSYMFSSYGVDANGDRSIYSNFQDNENNMFDLVVINGKSTYRLNGKFTPNIFLDLLNGGAKFNCLSEPFVQMQPSTCLYKIDPSIAHNVSVQYGRENSPAMIFMPESDSLTDGVNCTVVYQSISMTGGEHEMYGVEWGEGLGNKLVILCADGRMRNTSYKTDRSEGFFMVNGIPTRMLFIAPGDVVKLKSVEIVDKKRVWVVENQSDFSIMQSNFYFKKNDGDVADLFNVVCNNVGWYSQGMDSSFASASIMAKAPNNTTPLNYNVYLEDGSLEAY